MPRTERFLRQVLLFCILAALILYVASDAVRGSHGLIAKRRLEAQVAVLDKQIAGLKEQRVQLEREAELLGPKAAQQPALLDEEARALLDLVDPADIVIVDDAKPQAAE